MAIKLKKTRKHRGHVSAGYGRVGKHRKHPGGRGNAGGLHHHRSWFLRYHPDYFGKKGMRVIGYNSNAKYCPFVNIDHLWSLSGLEVSSFPREDGQVPMIDVTQHGYFKVLGTGHLPKVPIVVKAKLFSKIAVQKIRATGGYCILTA